jgi:hypothetical protein
VKEHSTTTAPFRKLNSQNPGQSGKKNFSVLSEQFPIHGVAPCFGCCRMNPFKCRHCDKPAHFYFREGGMLCVDHAKIFCQSLTDDLMARSRLDKSALLRWSGCPSGLPARPSVGLEWLPARSRFPNLLLTSPTIISESTMANQSAITANSATKGSDDSVGTYRRGRRLNASVMQTSRVVFPVKTSHHLADITGYSLAGL